jgi:hypothetical protein
LNLQTKLRLIFVCGVGPNSVVNKTKMGTADDVCGVGPNSVVNKTKMGTADELFARHFGCCWLHKET